RLPSEIRPELPSMIDRVIEKALAYSIADRYVKARDFGEAFYAAFDTASARQLPNTGALPATAGKTEPTATTDEPAWKNRSPEPPQTEGTGTKFIAAAVTLLALVLLSVGWYYVSRAPDAGSRANLNAQGNSQSAVASNTEMPPLPRSV